MKKTKNVKNIILIIILATVIIAVIIFFNSKPKVNKSFESQNVFRVQKLDLYDSINVVGKCVSDTVVLVFSDIIAPVSEVCIKKGDYINEGDVICKLDVSEIERQRDGYVKLLEEYEKYNNLKVSNYSDNRQYSSEINDKQITQLEDNINSIRSEYDNEINNGNDLRSKYEEASSEFERLNNESSSVNAELEPLKALVKEYENAKKENTAPDAETEGEENNSEENEEDAITVEATETPFDMEYYISLKTRKSKLDELKEFAKNKADFYKKKMAESSSYAETLKSELEKNESSYEQLKIQKKYDSILTAEEYSKSAASADTELLYREKIDSLNKKISDNIIKATASGIVTDVYVSVGDYISEKNVCRIQEQGAMHFESYVNPNKIAMISKDNRIMVSMAANNFKQIEGKILDISDYYDTENNGYKITFTFDEINSMDIYPGFEASARIILRSQEDTLAVPYDAIIEKDDKFYVNKVNITDNSTQEVKVKKGLATNYYIAVSSDELKENDRVMTGDKK